MSSSSNSFDSSVHGHKNCSETINILMNGMQEALSSKGSGDLPAALESFKKLASDFQSALPATNQAFKDWTSKKINGLTDARGKPVSDSDARKMLQESISWFARTANDFVREVQDQNLRTSAAMGCLASIEADLATTLGKVVSFAKSLKSSDLPAQFEQALQTTARAALMLNPIGFLQQVTHQSSERFAHLKTRIDEARQQSSVVQESVYAECLEELKGIQKSLDSLLPLTNLINSSPELAEALSDLQDLRLTMAPRLFNEGIAKTVQRKFYETVSQLYDAMGVLVGKVDSLVLHHDRPRKASGSPTQSTSQPSAQTLAAAAPPSSSEALYGVPEAQQYVEFIVTQNRLLKPQDLEILQYDILPIFEENQSLLGAEWLNWFIDVVSNYSSSDAIGTEHHKNILARLHELNTRIAPSSGSSSSSGTLTPPSEEDI